jgi:hypothetical protein
MVARCSSDLLGRARRLAQCWIWLAVGRPRSSARSSSGALTISALSSPDGGHPRQGGAASGGQQHAQRLPLTASSGRGQPVLAECLAGGPDRVQRVALGTAAGGQPLGTADLHDAFANLVQEHRQAGAEAARPFHRPAATAGDLHASEVEQLLVAGRVGAGGVCASTPPRLVTAAAVRVSRWVSTPGTPSTSSASMAMRWSSLDAGGRELASAWEESPRGITVMGHNPAGLDRLLIRRAWWARPTPAPGQTAQTSRQPTTGCQLHNESCRSASARA